MAILKDESKLERLYLPSTSDKAPDDSECAWVDLDLGPLTAGDMQGVTLSAGDVMASLAILLNRIKGWSYTMADGTTPLPISEENVRRLKIADFQFLVSKIPTKGASLTEQQKKT